MRINYSFWALAIVATVYSACFFSAESFPGDNATGTAGSGGIACGNERTDPGGGEICDGSDLGSADCESISQGFIGGILACKDDCSGYDTTACIPLTCGDGTIDGSDQCDGMNLDMQTCASQGFAAGTLACGPNCQFDVTGCNNCSNGVLDEGEVCDTIDLDGKTCMTEGYVGGALACNDSCSALVTMGCIACDSDDDCGMNETCTDSMCACGATTATVGPACTGTRPVCEPTLNVCICDATSCANGFICALGQCGCDGPDDCGAGDSCASGKCTCDGGGPPCSEGQVCDANGCTCANGSCPPGAGGAGGSGAGGSGGAGGA
jgi:hypothetical protein